MKKLFLLTTLLLVPDLAAAQSARPAPPHERPGARPTRPGGPQIQPPRPGNGGPQIQPPRPGNGGPQIQPPRPSRPQPPHRPGTGRPPTFRPIRGPAFHYPRGYRYRRWMVGAILPRLLLASPYRYSNYGALGIGPAPAGYRWIRYGPDLLLVRQRDGRIADVIRGAFY